VEEAVGPHANSNREGQESRPRQQHAVGPHVSSGAREGPARSQREKRRRRWVHVRYVQGVEAAVIGGGSMEASGCHQRVKSDDRKRGEKLNSLPHKQYTGRMTACAWGGGDRLKGMAPMVW